MNPPFRICIFLLLTIFIFFFLFKLISDLLIESVLTNRPKIRYSAGGMSWVFPIMKSFSEETLDMLMTFDKKDVALDPNAKELMLAKKDAEWFNPNDYV